MMIEPIIYSSFEEKNSLEQKGQVLSPEQAIIHTLDWLDFLAALKQNKNDQPDNSDGIEWIVLKYLDDQQ